MSGHNLFHVFYADQLHSTCETFPKINELGYEVYNGCYVHVTKQTLPEAIWAPVGSWFRGDRTPVLLSHVPPTLKTLILLLT